MTDRGARVEAVGGPESVWAVVLAGGRGSRFGSEVPKQYHDLAGRPVLLHALRSLLMLSEVAGAVVPAGRADFPRLEEQVLSRLDVLKPVQVVEGGATRVHSVRRGLRAIPDTARWVLVHDGARPCPGGALLSRLLAARDRARAVIPALPVAETIKEVDGEGRVLRTVDRRSLVRVQTPQLFELVLFREAHARGGEDVTDDAQLVEALGEEVRVVEGDPANVKITGAEDLEFLRALMARRGEGGA